MADIQTNEQPGIQDVQSVQPIASRYSQFMGLKVNTEVNLHAEQTTSNQDNEDTEPGSNSKTSTTEGITETNKQTKPESEDTEPGYTTIDNIAGANTTNIIAESPACFHGLDSGLRSQVEEVGGPKHNNLPDAEIETSKTDIASVLSNISVSPATDKTDNSTVNVGTDCEMKPCTDPETENIGSLTQNMTASNTDLNNEEAGKIAVKLLKSPDSNLIIVDSVVGQADQTTEEGATIDTKIDVTAAKENLFPTPDVVDLDSVGGDYVGEDTDEGTQIAGSESGQQSTGQMESLRLQEQAMETSKPNLDISTSASVDNSDPNQELPDIEDISQEKMEYPTTQSQDKDHTASCIDTMDMSNEKTFVSKLIQNKELLSDFKGDIEMSGENLNQDNVTKDHVLSSSVGRETNDPMNSLKVAYVDTFMREGKLKAKIYHELTDESNDSITEDTDNETENVLAKDLISKSPVNPQIVDEIQTNTSSEDNAMETNVVKVNVAQEQGLADTVDNEENQDMNTDDFLGDGLMITDVRSLTEEESKSQETSQTLCDNDTAVEEQAEINDDVETEMDVDTVDKTAEAIFPMYAFTNSANPPTDEPINDELNRPKPLQTFANLYNPTVQQTNGEGISQNAAIMALSAMTNAVTDKNQVSKNNQSETEKTISNTNLNELPVITNTFTIKEEPADDLTYGKMTSHGTNNVAQPTSTSNRGKISDVVNMLHGRKLNISPPNSAKVPKLIVTKVTKPMLSKPQESPTSISNRSRTLSNSDTTLVSSGHPNSSLISATSLISGNTIPVKRTINAPTNIVSRIKPNTSVYMTHNPNLQNILKEKVMTNEKAKVVQIAVKKSGDQQGSKNQIKVVTPPKHNLDTINIHSVGVPKLTELIARKNPIPTYKPPPVPEYIRTAENSKTHPCYECGDSFYLTQSLMQHTNRRSMKISYKCESCSKTLLFTNKCQMLGHLRSHMNIARTQAVPIHIKSDSIEIRTYYDDIGVGKTFDWYSEPAPKKSETKAIATLLLANNKVSGTSTTAPHAYIVQQSKPLNPSTIIQMKPVLSKTMDTAQKKVPIFSNKFCFECKNVVNVQSLQAHYQGHGDHYPCSKCPMYLKSQCALSAHDKLHEAVTPNAILGKIAMPETICCPECGVPYSTSFQGFQTYLEHVRETCFHLSSLPKYMCSKCSTVVHSQETLLKHIQCSLEHYYKCELCPMALKSVHNFQTHFSHKHSDAPKSDRIQAKIIYRCHVCDTLIDDRVFLMSHLEKHADEMCKTKPMEFRYCCLRCTLVFDNKENLNLHHKSQHRFAPKRKTFCYFCQKLFGSVAGLIDHNLQTHAAGSVTEAVIFCDDCGLVCSTRKIYEQHACLVRKTKVIGDKTSIKNVKKEKQKHDKDKYENGFTQIIEDESDPVPEHLRKSCQMCNFPYPSQHVRIQHMKSHRHEQIFMCINCDRNDFGSFHAQRSHEIMCTAMEDRKKALEMAAAKQPDRKDEDRVTPDTDGVDVEAEEDLRLDTVILTPKPRDKRKKPEHIITYSCDKCEETFTRKSKQEEHMKLEHGWHPCHLCGEIYQSNTQLKKHLMLNHEGKKFGYYCWVCRGRSLEKFFTEKAGLERHLGKQHRMKTWDESKFVQELPGLDKKGSSPEPKVRKVGAGMDTRIVDENKGEKLKLRVEGETGFKCAKCMITCLVKSDFLEHIVKHKTEDAVQCFECGLCFAVFPSLKKHLFMVHKVRNFEAYMKENDIKEDEEEFIVDNDGIEREPIRTKPVESSSSEEEEERNPLECKVCYKICDNDPALKKHMRNHGMAFIKKSRKRAKTLSPNEKQENANIRKGGLLDGLDGPKKAKLVLRIKKLDSGTLESVGSVRVTESSSKESSIEAEHDSDNSEVESTETPVEAVNNLENSKIENKETPIEAENDSENSEVESKEIPIEEINNLENSKVESKEASTGPVNNLENSKVERLEASESEKAEKTGMDCTNTENSNTETASVDIVNDKEDKISEDKMKIDDEKNDSQDIK